MSRPAASAARSTVDSPRCRPASFGRVVPAASAKLERAPARQAASRAAGVRAAADSARVASAGAEPARQAGQ
jgi:hypothetical protein